MCQFMGQNRRKTGAEGYPVSTESQLDKAPPPNTRGWRAPWRGTWGVLSDGRSQISRRVCVIEVEMVNEYKPTTPRQCRIIRQAAVLEALGEQTIDTLGHDPKSTRRTLTALMKSANAKLAPLRAASNGHGQDLATSIQAALRKENER